MTANAVGCASTHGVVVTGTGESSPLTDCAPAVGASMTTIDPSDALRIVVFGAPAAICPIDWLEFSAMNLLSLLATTSASRSGVLYLNRDVTWPVDSRTARTSAGAGLLLLMTMARSL